MSMLLIKAVISLILRFLSYTALPVLGIYEVFMFTAVETIVSTGAYHRVFRMMGALEEALEVNVVEYSYLELSA